MKLQIGSRSSYLLLLLYVRFPDVLQQWLGNVSQPISKWNLDWTFLGSFVCANLIHIGSGDCRGVRATNSRAVKEMNLITPYKGLQLAACCNSCNGVLKHFRSALMKHVWQKKLRPQVLYPLFGSFLYAHQEIEPDLFHQHLEGVNLYMFVCPNPYFSFGQGMTRWRDSSHPLTAGEKKADCGSSDAISWHQIQMHRTQMQSDGTQIQWNWLCTVYILWESKTIKRMVFRGPERELPLLQPVKI